MRTVSTRVDNTLHEQVTNRCNGIGCTASQYIKDLIARDLQGPPGSAILHQEPREVVKGTWRENATASDSRRAQPSEIHNEKSGWIQRLDRNGNVTHNMIPTESVNGVGYYQDSMERERKTRWYKGSKGEWIAMARVRV